MSPWHRESGFTLLELILVTVMIGVLAAFALPKFIDLSDESHDVVVNTVMGSLTSGAVQYNGYWLVAGDGSTGRVDLVVDGISVRYRNGFVVNVNSNAHVPVGTPNRGSASARLFHLFNRVVPSPIVSRNSSETGWAMLANGSCAAVSRARCWEYRVNGSRYARITYASGEDGRFILD